MPPDPSRYRLRRHVNGIWRACWTEGRVTRSRSTGARSEGAAAQWLARWLDEQARPANDDAAPGPATVADVLAHHLDEARSRCCGLDRIRFAGKALARHMGDRPAAELRPVDSRRYAEARAAEGAGPGTVGYELRILRAALRVAHDDGLTDRLAGVRPPARPAPKDRWISPEEAARFVAAAATTPHLALFLALALATGARKGAILALTWDRVDLAARLLDFQEPGRGVTRKGRATVPINAALYAALLEARRHAGPDPGRRHVVEYQGRPVRDLRRSFDRAAALAGLEPLTPHALRHSVATWLAERGVVPAAVARLLGHADDRTTQRVYIKRRAEALREVVDMLDD